MTIKTYRHLCDKCGQKAELPLDGPNKGICSECVAKGESESGLTDIAVNVVNYTNWPITVKIGRKEEPGKLTLNVNLLDGSKPEEPSHN